MIKGAKTGKTRAATRDRNRNGEAEPKRACYQQDSWCINSESLLNIFWIFLSSFFFKTTRDLIMISVSYTETIISHLSKGVNYGRGKYKHVKIYSILDTHWISIGSEGTKVEIVTDKWMAGLNLSACASTAIISSFLSLVVCRARFLQTSFILPANGKQQRQTLPRPGPLLPCHVCWFRFELLHTDLSIVRKRREEKRRDGEQLSHEYNHGNFILTSYSFTR